MDPNQPNQEPFPGPGPGGPYGSGAPYGSGPSGPYGAPGGRYGPVPNGQYPPPGWPPRPYPHGAQPYPSAPQAFPTVMPGTVHAARIILFVVAGLGIVATIVQGTTGDPEWRSYLAGYDIGLYFVIWVMALLACFYHRGRNGIRITTIVLAVLQLLMSLGRMSAVGREEHALSLEPTVYHTAGPLYGVLTFVAALLAAILLSQSASTRWFKRPRR